MRKIRYPLIMSDYDGTLLRSDMTIAEETKDMIARYVADGGIFVLSSGRMTPSIINEARKLSLKGMVAAYNGAEIVDIQSGERLFQGYLPVNEAIEICRKMEAMGLHFHVYDGDNFYSNDGGELFVLYEQVCQVKGNVIADVPLSQWVEKRQLKVVKIVALMPFETREKVYERMYDAFGDDYLVLRSAKFLVELCDKRYSKGTALQYIADYYGIDRKETVAVGDNQNDLAMLQAAGVGLAVKSAEESLRGKIEFFDATNDENAVGKIIEEYGYTKEN